MFLETLGFLRWFLWQWFIALPSLRSHHAMLHSKTFLSSQTGASKLFCIGFSLFWSRSRNWGIFLLKLFLYLIFYHNQIKIGYNSTVRMAFFYRCFQSVLKTRNLLSRDFGIVYCKYCINCRVLSFKPRNWGFRREKVFSNGGVGMAKVLEK